MAKSKMGKKLTKAIDAVEELVDLLGRIRKVGSKVSKALKDLEGDNKDKPED